MGTINRGIKNAFRNNIRTFSIMLILAISIAMSLIMLMALKSVQSKIDSVKSSIGNTISVSPAGMRGFEGSGTLLTNQNAKDIQSINHVSSVIETLNGRLTTIGSSSNSFGRDNEDGNAQTSLTAPDMQAPANENSDNGGRRMMANGQDVTGRSNFSMPITAIGINDLSNLSALEASSFTISAGEKIDASSSDYIAMLGKDLAEKNNLSVGSTFTAYGQTISVKGIYDAGNTFANSRIILPLAAMQALSGQTDLINSLIVTTDSVDSLSAVQSAIKDKLGSDTVDVTTSEQSAESAITPLENIKTISLYSLIGSLVAGAVIIFLTMVMIVRERRREIGVLKAIGASNSTIMAQFTIESMVLTLFGSIAGMILGAFLSNPILKVLVSNSESSSQGIPGPGQGMGKAMMRMGASFGTNARSALNDLHAVVGWEIIIYGFLAAIIVAILGSAIPSYFIAKIRPAEVMRHE